jgi:hypothetical protein
LVGWDLVADSPLDLRGSDRVFTFTDGVRTVAIELHFVEARWQAARMEICAFAPEAKSASGPLTVRAVRDLPLGELVVRACEALRQSLTEVVRETGGSTVRTDGSGHHRVSVEGTAAKRGLERLDDPPRRPGRPRIPRSELEEFARRWRQAAAVSTAPTAIVARDWPMSKSKAAKWLRRCRDLELIPPA